MVENSPIWSHRSPVFVLFGFVSLDRFSELSRSTSHANAARLEERWLRSAVWVPLKYLPKHWSTLIKSRLSQVYLLLKGYLSCRPEANPINLFRLSMTLHCYFKHSNWSNFSATNPNAVNYGQASSYASKRLLGRPRWYQYYETFPWEISKVSSGKIWKAAVKAAANWKRLDFSCFQFSAVSDGIWLFPTARWLFSTAP